MPPPVPSSAPTCAQQCTHPLCSATYLCPRSATYLCPPVPTHLCPPVPPTCAH
ncbi:unnamed protein product, partial [Staurois parvus]